MNAVDTNILVYAVSADEPVRGPAAAALLDRLSAADTVRLWQVACEVGAVISRLYQRGRVKEEAFSTVSLLRGRFPLVLPSSQMLNKALQLHRQNQASYWDAMLLAACEDCGVTRLYSEDCQAAPQIAGVEIVNPLPPRSA